MTRLSIAVAVLMTLALAGCGGSSSGTTATTSTQATTGSSSGGALSLAADSSGQLKFDKTSLTTAAGSVKISFSNSAPLAHNLTVASSSGQVVGSTPTFQGGSKTLTVTLKPGSYTFYCSVPGHRQGGMQGTLVVH